MKRLSSGQRTSSVNRLQKHIAERPAKPPIGTRFLAAIDPAVKVATVAPITDNKGDVNEVATLIKSIHSAGRMATTQHRSMKGK